MLRSIVRIGLLALLALVPVPALAAPPPTEDAPALGSASELQDSELQDAERLAREVLAERESRAETDELGIADALDALVSTLTRLDRTKDPETRRLAERAVAIRKRVQGPDHLDLAKSLANIATVLRDLEDFQGSLELREEALAIRERLLGSSSVAVAAGLADLGHALIYLGQYDRAKGSYERELSIFEQAEGLEGANVAKACSHLAMVNELVGDYAGARGYAERSLTLQERHQGSESPEVGSASNALASIDLAAGDYESARTGFARALQIWEKAYGRKDGRVAPALENLGKAEGLLDELPEAKTHLEEALAIQEESNGPEDLQVAFSLCDLASVEWRLGHRVEARRMLQRAVAIRETKLGAENPLTAAALARLGEVNAGSGRPVPAQETLRRAVAIEEKTLGSQHPALAATLASLASVQLGVGDVDEAFETALRAEGIGREHLALTARVLPERQALRYEAVRASGSGLALTIAAAFPTPDRSRAAWDAVIRSRALILDELASRRRSASQSQDPKINELVERLRVAREKLARLAVRDLSRSQGEADVRALEEARVERESAERDLAAKSTPFRRELEAHQRGFEQVATVLPWRSALVGFVCYERSAPDPADRTRSLLAFVMRGGDRSVAAIPLGTCVAVDSTVRRWNRELQRSILEPTPPNVAAERAAGVAVRRLVWDPLETAIGDVERVFLVPDGAVHLVSFAALPMGEREFLLERIPALHYLGSERDLCAEAAEGEVGRGLFVLDAPDFDRAANARAASLIAPPVTTLAFRGTLPDCPEFARIHFDALPGARSEGEAVVDAWSSAGGWRRLLRRDAGSIDRLSGSEASEAAFKSRVRGHRVVHLATHGFVLDRLCVDRGAARASSSTPARAAWPNALAANPLLRSGLALAGANARASVAAGEEDGILTAEEIASLDLGGVEWAVLSACESGTGDIVDGEGILGLCRAFRVAGARTLLLSLWPVGDEPARRWIRELYASRLGRGRSTDRAVGEASLMCLRRLRERGESPHPFLWASFVATGDWH